MNRLASTTRIAVEPARLFARLPAVTQATGLGRSTMYRLVANGAFPRPVHLGLGRRAIAWLGRALQARVRLWRLLQGLHEGQLHFARQPARLVLRDHPARCVLRSGHDKLAHRAAGQRRRVLEQALLCRGHAGFEPGVGTPETKNPSRVNGLGLLLGRPGTAWNPVTCARSSPCRSPSTRPGSRLPSGARSRRSPSC